MIVIDASLAFKWFVEEIDSDAAIAFASISDLVAPSLLRSEVGNALWKKVVSKEITAAGAESALASIDAFIFEWVELAELTPSAFAIAVELGHPIYDCYYLALAQARDLNLATADDRFAARCTKSRFASLLVEWRQNRAL
ncbi:type II toxin-antitoxin system VapC family toxin [Sphingomonas radiodurans]|uniref:type II toxin-antitoxin system VapC family toxin n=1 Tax=Sphingomonas radiodurans TaxID=2890321 RepID=UPI001E511D8C|nr:type II toxin-antitoxin system VapC family toxin [Sphingomonas radiodurans]WBH15988.1 type II toxin-antitoxin system VapC family toxin [Sphingomonas radiodurans]